MKQMQSEIAELNTQIESLEDPRDRYAAVQEKIRQYRASGDKVPDDLRLMERQLITECMYYSQGR